MKIRIVVADDHRLIRQGLTALIDDVEDMEVVGEAADGEETLEKARTHIPDVVLMDVKMPVMDGIEAAQNLSRDIPGLGIVFLSLNAEWMYPTMLVQKKGTAYVLKESPFSELEIAIRTVAKGGRYVCEGVQRSLIGQWQKNLSRDDSGAIALTPCEKRVLGSLRPELAYKESAALLGMRLNTLRTHLRRISKKTGAHGKGAFLDLHRQIERGSTYILTGRVPSPSCLAGASSRRRMGAGLKNGP